jgi:hypothetical protein
VIFASAISLFLVPASYLILEDLSGLLRRGRTEEPEPAALPTAETAADEPDAARIRALPRSRLD